MSSKMFGLLSLMIIWSLKAHIAASVHSTQPQVPCYFIFGDSLSDPGNNNVLVTSAKANYFPYGIDFEGGDSSGRFTNNETFVDVISRLLKIPQYIPSHSSAVASPEVDISYGVNFASGGAGIRDETGYLLGGRFPLSVQLQFFNDTKLKLLLIKGDETMEYLSQCLYTLEIGSNDYINNYFAPKGYHTSTIYTPEQYATVLMNQYSQQIRTLYCRGARKIAVFALGYLGCAPAEILLYGASRDTGCVDKINSAVLLFNAELRELINQLNQDLTDAKLLYVDLSSVPLTAAQGFTVFNQSCCRVTGSDGMCDKGVEPCRNRNNYIFYDNFHPTNAVNILTGTEAYKQILALIP